MPRAAILGFAALAACTAAPSAPPVGSVGYGGETYAIRALADNPAVWRIEVDGQIVTCRAPTETDCYWSLRNFLHAQDVLDDLGS